MWRHAVTKVTPTLTLVAKQPLIATSAVGVSRFSTSFARGYDYIISEKKGEGGSVGLVTLNR